VKSINARTAAIRILNSLESRRQTLDILLSENDKWLDRLSREDRSLFNNLVFGVLRWRKRLDWTIGLVSNTPVVKIDPGCSVF